ncbi:MULTISPECIES: hypothetical protein [Pseudanabaena]|uniref:Uncharacterized protein n=2 Tax=Pseudanabaena TaxID=1152 RepID=L8N4G0_9CYAN|nr:MULTISPECIES: hypothetical protein [Pseudanabaena]ELS34556.1 hypothetical protein Pse7429DRAFT_0222 [Pseudanabaena biceps PCC 7429]MDG3493241.1 hypothetical protein [Pseudanabaena catenata USMAC16]
MTPVQIEKTQTMLTERQLYLFFRLSKIRDWLGELYLELVLSQEEIEYIYSSETNICFNSKKDRSKQSHYLMR